jgi:8-oxo-dGTP diphosphatase
MKASTEHPYPRAGVSVLIQKDGKLLLGLRTGSHGAETWAPPSGKLELGESWEDCARREVAEETGLEIDNIHFLAATNDIFKNEDLHYVTLILKADWVANEARVLEPTKCREWRWVNPTDLPEPLFLVLQNLQKDYPEVFSKF